MSTAWRLASACGFDRFTNQPKPEWLISLAETAQVETALLQALSFGPPDDRRGLFQGTSLPSNVFDGRGGVWRRVCPECLRESAHHRAMWHLSFVAVCPVHNRELVDQCRSCGGWLGWLGRDLARCGRRGCIGGDLTHVRAAEVSDADARGTRAVYGLLGDERFVREADHARSLPPFRDLGDGEIVEFLYRLGLEALGGRSKIFSLEQPGELAYQAHRALTLGLEAAERWPDGFYQILDAMRRRSAATVLAGLRKYIGPVERWLDGLPEGQGGTVKERVFDYRRNASMLTQLTTDTEDARE